MNPIASIHDIQHLVTQGFTDWKQYGNVTARRHGDLMILNYIALAQYEGRWNFFEQVSRGLILHTQTGEIVARGFDKFFGWLEGGRYTAAPLVVVTEKVDGSLGLLYRTPTGYRISTRGDLTSRQGAWATQFLNSHYDLAGLPDELTLIFEIIYPANRIIVNYGERQDLVLLAARNRFTGNYLPFTPDVTHLAAHYGFSLPITHSEFKSVEDILKHLPTLDADHEGYVVEFADDSRFKFKGARYLELHKLVFGLSFKNTLEAVQNGTVQAILDAVPDEFLSEVKTWISEIEGVLTRTQVKVQAAFDAAPKDTRKEFALWVQANQRDIAAYLFAMFDGRPIEPLIYRYHSWGHTDEVENEAT
ncbi:MAG: hypothetical protein HY862_10710 [Chloroflexi bacterium]|nr:hypothetical protein [Chloroflexota bacterium]